MSTRINELFKRLRKEGMLARQNFSCCGSCASYEIAEDVTKMIDAGKPAPKGAVFYHAQDAEALKPRRPSSYGHGQGKQTMMLRYGQVDTTKHGPQGLETKEVGEIVTRLLKDVGIGFEWDGNPDVCIEIDVDDALDEMPRAVEAAPVAKAPRVEEPFEMMPDAEGYVPGTRLLLPKVRLVGTDSNAFSIMGRVRAALRKAKVPREVEQRFVAEATSGDYSKVIATAMRYAEVM